MPRYRLTIEYDGGRYHGYQAQPGLASVQGALETAVLGFCGEDVRVSSAGRTDAGVHATGQVVHIDLTKDWPPETVRNALNAHLVPQPIGVLDASIAPEGWHARFSATERRYRYRILNRMSPPALDQGRVWHVQKPLDADAMHAAALAARDRRACGPVAPSDGLYLTGVSYPPDPDNTRTSSAEGTPP